VRQFAFYIPSIDIIVFQTVVDECFVGFEWDHYDLHKEYLKFGDEHHISKYELVYLGEL